MDVIKTINRSKATCYTNIVFAHSRIVVWTYESLKIYKDYIENLYFEIPRKTTK